MKFVEQSWEYVVEPNGKEMLRIIEEAGRTCYKSEDKITDESAKNFVANAIKTGHHSIIEHANVGIRIICDRGVTHEIVRHRLAAYSQESTRYCNYGKGKFGGEITCVIPTFVMSEDDKFILRLIEEHYLRRLDEGLTPQDARYFLPNGLKTEIVMTCNIREWRHVFALRTSPKAHPQIRKLMKDVLQGFQATMPILFENI